MAMANHADFGTVDWSSLVISVGGGMAVQQATAKLWLEKTGCPIVEGYGLSETSPWATCNPVDSTAFSGNIGLPMPNTELTLLDDDGREVGPGQAGEIAIRGPAGDGRLLAAPDETAKVMTADGFFRTGDVGMVDERGYFRIVDRKKDMILVSGFNVYPNEVEDVMTQMDGILECAAVGIPDEKAGEGGEAGDRQEEPGRHRGRRARLLRGQPDRLQAAQGGGVPHRAAQDAGGGALSSFSTERGEAEACRSARRPISVLGSPGLAVESPSISSASADGNWARGGQAGRARISGRAQARPAAPMPSTPAHATLTP